MQLFQCVSWIECLSYIKGLWTRTMELYYLNMMHLHPSILILPSCLLHCCYQFALQRRLTLCQSHYNEKLAMFSQASSLPAPALAESEGGSGSGSLAQFMLSPNVLLSCQVRPWGAFFLLAFASWTVEFEPARLGCSVQLLKLLFVVLLFFSTINFHVTSSQVMFSSVNSVEVKVSVCFQLPVASFQPSASRLPVITNCNAALGLKSTEKAPAFKNLKEYLESLEMTNSKEFLTYLKTFCAEPLGLGEFVSSLGLWLGLWVQWLHVFVWVKYMGTGTHDSECYHIHTQIQSPLTKTTYLTSDALGSLKFAAAAGALNLGCRAEAAKLLTFPVCWKQLQLAQGLAFILKHVWLVILEEVRRLKYNNWGEHMI